MGIAKSIGKLIGHMSRRTPSTTGDVPAEAFSTRIVVNVMPPGDDAHAQGNIAKREALRGAGVDVDGLTEDVITSDAVAIANRLCGAKIRANKRPERVEPQWENLTKTGKVPKKVAEGFALFEWPGGDSVIAHVWYLASLEPYAADVYVWRGHDCHEYYVRTRGGEMVVDHEGVSDMDTGYRENIK